MKTQINILKESTLDFEVFKIYLDKKYLDQIVLDKHHRFIEFPLKKENEKRMKDLLYDVAGFNTYSDVNLFICDNFNIIGGFY